jgi:hypothetical protein
MLPIWVSHAVLTHQGSNAPEFGLASASPQSGWLVYWMAEAIRHLREGNLRRATLLILHIPLQTAYTLAMVPRVALGVIKGFSRSLNAFVVTPKRIERIGFTRYVAQQRAALSLALFATLPASLLLTVGEDGQIAPGVLWFSPSRGSPLSGSSWCRAANDFAACGAAFGGCGSWLPGRWRGECAIASAAHAPEAADGAFGMGATIAK